MAKVHWFEKGGKWFFDTPSGDKGGPFDTRTEAKYAGYDSIRKDEAPKPAPKMPVTAKKPSDA